MDETEKELIKIWYKRIENRVAKQRQNITGHTTENMRNFITKHITDALQLLVSMSACSRRAEEGRRCACPVLSGFFLYFEGKEE